MNKFWKNEKNFLKLIMGKAVWENEIIENLLFGNSYSQSGSNF